MKLDDKIHVLENFISLDQLKRIRTTIEMVAGNRIKVHTKGMNF